MKNQPELHVNNAKRVPASLGQQRVWFLNQLEPQSAAYNISLTYHIEGLLNATAVAAAVTAVCHRHTSLRTTFDLIGNQPMQIIHPTSGVQLNQIDLSQLTTAVAPENIYAHLQAIMQAPFDLKTGPLLRVTLLTLSNNDHYLNLTAHSSIADKQSLQHLFQELNIAPRTPNDTASASNYLDFVSWQQNWLQSAANAALTDYWSRTLANLPTGLKLPTDSLLPETAVLTPAPQLCLTTHDTEQLNQLAAQHNTTLFTILMATFQLLLHRLTGQEGVVVGTAVSGRYQTRFDKVIGPFQNMLPIVSRFEPTLRFSQLIAQVHQTVAGALAHQQMPFEHIVEAVDDIERDINRHPIFNTTLNFSETAVAPTFPPQLTISPLNIGQPETKLTLTLNAHKRADTIELQLHYRTDLFVPRRAVAILQQFEQLLSQIVADPNRSIYGYSLVTAVAHPLLPNPAQPMLTPRYPLVTEAFAKMVHQQPQHTAVRQNGRLWTYDQLDAASQHIARYLQAQGIQKGDVVAVFGLRSFGTIASMLGVFMSGGVLLPLDHNLPRGRQEIMLAISKAKHLLYVGPYRGQDGWIPEVMPVTAVAIDSGYIKANVSAETPLAELDYEDAAYLFYTSGTTGSPKGVLGSHKGLAHFLAWQRKTFAIGPNDRSAQLTGLSFDVVLRDIFTPLTAGATLCLPDSGGGLSPTVVLPWLENEQITLLHTVPSLAQTWLDHVSPTIKLQSLRLIFSAGEPLTDIFVQRWRQAFPESGQFINIYGPTETTLAKFYYPVPQSPLPGIQPIGHPLPQTEGLILSPAQALCGIGEPGEIVIRTPFRTYGYINAPQEQVKRFVPNPFAQNDQDVVYFTGDIGRYRLDGSVEILGRVDQQVKIRGVRVDLEEIKHVIEQHLAVRQTAVLAREEIPGQCYLAAYIIPESDAPFDIVDMQRYLRQRLPDAMVPTALVIMASLPLTANGKLDRRALPIPESTQANRKRPLVLPRTDLEKQLVSIWEATLKTRPIGIEDDFFALGGHSLLAVQLFAQIEKETGVNLPLATLFREATISHLAQLIAVEQPAGKNTWESLVTIQPQGSETPFFCIHGITGDILWFKELGRLFAPERPFMGLQSRGLDGVQTVLTDLPSMASYYIDAIKQKQPHGPYLIGGASFGGTVSLEMARQLQARGDEVALLVIFDHAPPNVLASHSTLAKGPEIASNFPRWLQGFVQLGPTRMWRRVLRKLRTLNSPPPSPYNPQKELTRIEAANIIDYAHELPEHRRRLIEVNFQAIDSYQPQPYNGRVLFIKARSRSLFSQTDPVMVWQQLVSPENLTVAEVPGTHESIFTQPNVATLGVILKQALHKASNTDL